MSESVRPELSETASLKAPSVHVDLDAVGLEHTQLRGLEAAGEP
jgi:hypothetical protein